MKKFIIINGTSATVHDKECMSDAKTYATNYSDHSKEVIVREITSLKSYSTLDKAISIFTAEEIAERWGVSDTIANAVIDQFHTNDGAMGIVADCISTMIDTLK